MTLKNRAFVFFTLFCLTETTHPSARKKRKRNQPEISKTEQYIQEIADLKARLEQKERQLQEQVRLRTKAIQIHQEQLDLEHEAYKQLQKLREKEAQHFHSALFDLQNSLRTAQQFARQAPIAKSRATKWSELSREEKIQLKKFKALHKKKKKRKKVANPHRKMIHKT